MVVWKFVSIRELKLSLIEEIEKELHEKFYGAVHNFWQGLRVKYFVRARIFFLAVFYATARKILHWALIVGQKLKVRHNKWYDIVKGKGSTHKKGSVSFFLRDVAEYKKQHMGK